MAVFGFFFLSNSKLHQNLIRTLFSSLNDQFKKEPERSALSLDCLLLPVVVWDLCFEIKTCFSAERR